MTEVRIRRVGEPGDLGWVVLAHGEVYAAEFGWDASFEAHVARIVADHATGAGAREAGWIAETDGRRVGCVFCTAADERTAQLRILLVDPGVRGHRVGTRLVATCLEFAQASGYRSIRLWTTDVLTAARRLYLAAGFRLVHEEPCTLFGADLVGQDYERELSVGSGMLAP